MDTFTLGILCAAAFVLAIIASIKVKTTFSKYNRVHTKNGRTAAEIAREILDDNGLQHIVIEEHPGELTDHYDPKREVVALSQSVYRNDTVGAISVAAHEVGHAIQHAQSYAPVVARTAVFPVVSICTRLWYVALVLGLVLEMVHLMWLAIILYAFVVVFQLITLPVELDASSRAMKTIEERGYLVGDEIAGARKTLTAAAFTYITALVFSLLQLLRLLASSRR